MESLKKRINEVFDMSAYLQLIGAFDPNFDFWQMKEMVLSIYHFIEENEKSDIESKLPLIREPLEKMFQLSQKKYPPKKSISEISVDYNSLFKDKGDIFNNGIEYGWLLERIDLKNFWLYDIVPYHFKIGLATHKGFGGIEEDFLLKDSFSVLIKAEYYNDILNKYAEKTKKEEAIGKKFNKEIYSQITDLKYEISAFSRLSIICFYAFIECFINSIGFSYLQYNRRLLTPDEIEILSGFKKGRFLQLKSKIEKFQSILRPDKKCIINLTDEKQMNEPFLSFFSNYEELRNSSVHFSPKKEKIWMNPQEWLIKAQEFSKISINVGLHIWQICHPNSDGPQYMGKLDYDLHYKLAKERLNKILHLEREYQ